MKTFMRLAAYFMAAAIVAFAPVGASAQPAKLFTLQMSPASLSGILVATITNATPNGNSTINSATLTIASSPGWLIQSAVPSAGQASVSADQKTISIINIPPVKPNKSFTVTITLAAFNCGDSALWDAVPWTGSNLTGNTFAYGSTQTDAMRTSTTSCDGTVFCGNALPAGTGPGVTASRLLYNKDGSTCFSVNYDFTNAISATNSTLLQWNLLSQAPAAFEYTVTWTPEVAGAQGGPASVTKVAWYVNGNLIPAVPAKACISSDPPTPYAYLAADITTTTQTQIQVNTPVNMPPPVNFAIIVDKERMLVTNVSGNTWTVVRGQGGTTAATHTMLFASDSTPKPAMSTPLPLDSNNKVMQMCLISETWVSLDPSDCGLTDGNTACVQKTSHAFDLGDGFMKGN
jgi:hypothetical protein